MITHTPSITQLVHYINQRPGHCSVTMMGSYEIIAACDLDLASCNCKRWPFSYFNRTSSSKVHKYIFLKFFIKES